MGSKGFMSYVIMLAHMEESGRRGHVPQLLKYSCQIECRVKPTSPTIVIRTD
ncbi:hypothetical protein M8C21_032934 [Ambrosia artemisiifolia]|uniref:Uncharacterized protein n=1 Tax=Ambrosia artemisiifolia TaxID=4212 RepID=A0AAD5D3F2_AMBAR|nr:hypothetical protein M8C21_032934 [Ambrosia artemisiifolia]